jgi:Flp pilus assembly protein TadD
MSGIDKKRREAIALHQNGKVRSAIGLYNEIIQNNPRDSETLYCLGVANKDIGDFPSSAKFLMAAVIVEPNKPLFHNELGVVLAMLKFTKEALDSFDRALDLNKSYKEALSNRANILKGMARWSEALDAYDKAIAIDSAFLDAVYNRAVTLQEMMLLEDALAGYRRVLALKRDHAKSLVNASIAKLTRGDFDAGFKDFEWRWDRKSFGLQKRSFSKPLWLGKESLAGKTILLYWEQGLGDTIQFCRYASLVAGLGARVILEVQRPLTTLLADIPGVSHLIEDGHEPPVPFDYVCPLMSLPLAFQTSLRNIPADVPYIKCDAAKSEEWKNKLGKWKKPRVGLVWSGGFRPSQPESWAANGRRNLPLSYLAPFADADAEFYSLQKGQKAEEELRDLVNEGWSGPDIIDFTNSLNDFSDTAALVDNLDLVISVDTSTAHLAGAMGKPVWILNRFDTCWRWLLDRVDSPWYPTVRLYRQKSAGDWRTVVDDVTRDLSSYGQPAEVHRELVTAAAG